MSDNYINFEMHKRIIGILFTVLGSVSLVFILLGSLVFSEVIRFFVEDSEAVLVSNIIRYAVVTISVLVSIPAIIAGIGMLQQKEWAFTMSFILGILALPFFPLWTVVGLYVIIIYLMAHSHKHTSGNTSETEV
ncbi:MAG: hypothetical protein JJU28_16145 [Cyclobacteriaceae bacterium]|nr:hypothetical protein [Cyclobacteriaceae bacterium]